MDQLPAQQPSPPAPQEPPARGDGKLGAMESSGPVTGRRRRPLQRLANLDQTAGNPLSAVQEGRAWKALVWQEVVQDKQGAA